MQDPTTSARRAAARIQAAIGVLIVVAPAALPRSARATEFDLASIPGADLGLAPTALACADLDGDGRADLVTLELAGPAMRIRRGLGGATFAAQPAIPLPAAAGGIEAADLDQDGDVDLSIAIPTLGVGILANDGASGFSLPTILPLPHASERPFVRDLDGDGIVDVLALGASTPDASLLRGAGGGAFLAPIPIALGVAPTDACLGALDGDGDLDLVLSNGPSGVVARLVNLGGGAFSAPTLVPLLGTEEIELADADDDGDLDLVTTFTWVDALAVLANDGSGSFGAATFATGLPVLCWGLARGDFDGDGRDDVGRTGRTEPGSTPPFSRLTHPAGLPEDLPRPRPVPVVEPAETGTPRARRIGAPGPRHRHTDARHRGSHGLRGRPRPPRVPLQARARCER